MDDKKQNEVWVGDYFCPNCNGMVEGDEEICPSCGTRITDDNVIERE